MTVRLPYEATTAKYPEYTGLGAWNILPGWQSTKTDKLEIGKLYEALFVSGFYVEVPWSILAWWNPKDPPPGSHSSWQHGPYGQGFSDVPTHFREVCL
jgi:hypothetical protein